MTRYAHWLLASFALLCASSAYAQSFTYQGFLCQSGSPVNGSLSMTFRLYSVATGGSPLGTVGPVSVSVSNGLFMRELDFGSVWDGSDRWLEIQVGSTTLSPRVKINPTPYAIRANTAGTANPIGAAGGDLSGSYPNPTVARLQGRSVANTAPSNGDVLKWNGTAWAPATDLRDAFWQQSGSNIFYNAGNVGIGTSSPSYPLTVSVSTASDRGIYVFHSATSGTTLGVYAITLSTSGVGVFGSADATSGTTYGVRGTNQSSSGAGVWGQAFATTGATSGVFGASRSPTGAGVYGRAEATTGVNYGVYGESQSPTGRGVYGLAETTTGQNYGVYGESRSSDGSGVYGVATATSGFAFGVYGTSASTRGTGVVGIVTSTTGITSGVDGVSYSTQGRGVQGRVFSTTGDTYGVIGDSASSTGRGVAGIANSSTGVNYGVFGRTNSPSGYAGYFEGRGYFSANVGIGVTNPSARLQVSTNTGADAVRIDHTGSGRGLQVQASSDTAVWGVTQTGFAGVDGRGQTRGVYGVASTTVATAYGVHGRTESFTGAGVYGVAVAGNAYGVHGVASGPNGRGVYGEATATSGGGVRGVWGVSASSEGQGVYGAAIATTGTNYGVYGISFSPSAGYAGYFAGRVHVDGTLSKSAGSFKIDHPLDPENKYLVHSFVESPDMMNIYNGNVTTDARGYAIVTLPEWFEVLNTDFRYQLTVIGQFAQAIVAQEIRNNQFVIRTDKPNVKVSWQVTGVRKDPYAQQHRIPVEEWKLPEHRGKYLHPELYGQPKERGIHYRPEFESPAEFGKPY